MPINKLYAIILELKEYMKRDVCVWVCMCECVLMR